MKAFCSRYWVVLFVGVMFTLSISMAVQLDQSKELSPVQSIAPGAKTASTTNGASADMANYGAATVVVNVGLHSDGTHKIQLEESTNDSTFTTVAASDISGATVSIANTTVDNTVYWFGYLGVNRYLRVASAVTGTTTAGLVFNATIIRGLPRYKPTY